MKTAVDWITLAGVIVALCALILQQREIISAQNRQEERLANKLRIYYFCVEPRSEDDIMRHFSSGDPLNTINSPEIRKSLYEMLAEQTLVFSVGTRQYQTRSFNVIKPAAGP
jgi:hypothetical protein